MRVVKSRNVSRCKIYLGKIVVVVVGGVKLAKVALELSDSKPEQIKARLTI